MIVTMPSLVSKLQGENFIKTKLNAGISGNIGLIQLKILDNKKLEWLVLHIPNGEIFVPKKAMLHRCQ